MILEHQSLLSSKRIILASQSPRRREILTLMGLPFEVIKSNFEETLDKASFSSPSEYVKATAHGKAADVASILTSGEQQPADLIIGSDTVVVLDGTILEKPSSEGDAFRMLKSLSGRQHVVATGVCVIAKGGRVETFCEQSKVWFTQLTDEMIAAYIKSGEPMDKAGSYGIQGYGGAFVSKIEGCFFAVMGLPMHAVARHVSNLIAEGVVV